VLPGEPRVVRDVWLLIKRRKDEVDNKGIAADQGD